MKQKTFVAMVISAHIENGLTGDELKIASYRDVADGLMSGECEYSSGPLPEKEAIQYAKAVVNDTLKKSPKFNATGKKYIPETRRGPLVKNPKFKELTKIEKALVAADVRPDLVEKIRKEKAEIAAAERAEKASTTNMMSVEDALSSLESLGIKAS